jgi:hypothetical protein
MDSSHIKAEFAGFGPIPSSSTTFSQGIGLGGSFAPLSVPTPMLPPRARPQPQTNFPFWDWSETQTGVDQSGFPVYAYNVWFGKPEEDSEKPSEVYTLSLYTAVENEGITLDGTDIPKLTAYMADGAYGNLGGDGSLSLRNSDGLQLDLEPTKIVFTDGDNSGELSAYAVKVIGPSKSAVLESTYLTMSDDNGDQAFLDTAQLSIGSSIGNGVYEAIQLTLTSQTGQSYLSTAALQIEVGDFTGVYEAEQLTLAGTEGTSYLSTVALNINGTSGDGTYEPHQLTLSLDDGSQSYLSTSSLHILNAVGDGTYEPHQATLRDQNGGVDLNTAEIKTYQSSGSYAAIGSDGTLSLSDSQGNQLDLNPTEIVFDDGTSTGILSSSQMEISEGDDSSRVLKNSITITDGTDTVSLSKANLDFTRDGDSALTLNTSSGAGTMTCKDTIDGEGYYSSLIAKVKGGSGGFSQMETNQFYIESSDGDYVLIDIPDNNGTALDAYWQEIDICVDGVAKKMKVLGTEPY